MARIALGGLTTLNLGTHLDPMFIELYAAQAGDFSTATSFTFGNGTGLRSLTINGGNAAVQGASVTFQRNSVVTGGIGDNSAVFPSVIGGIGLSAVGSNPIALATNSVSRQRIEGTGNTLFGSLASGTAAAGDSGVILYGNSLNYGRVDITKGTVSGTGQTFAMSFNYGTTSVGGVLCSSTATTFNTSSDVRLKENIEDMPDQGALFDAMRPRTFEFKIDPGRTNYGFIAQELHQVAPFAVYQGNDGEINGPEDTWSVDFSKLIPLLVKEIQTLRARVAALEAYDE